MAAVSFPFTPLLYSPLQAQAPSTGRVIIRDTVVISSGSAVTPVSGRMSLSGTDTFYVAPRPGALALVPYRAYKYGAALPNDSYLEIRLSDTTYTPQLLPYLPCVQSVSVSRYNCSDPIQTTRYDYEWCGEEPADTFYTRRLQTGDTVWFAFQGEFYNPAYAIAEGHVDTFLAAFMETATPPGCSQPHQPDEFCEVDFFLSDTTVVIVRPDSLNVYPYYPAIRNDTVTVGAKKRFVDPCPNIATSQHYRNHFGTSALLNAIERIAATYDSLNPGIILRINDLSLEKGGLFDVNNNWSPGHSEHRVGMNADIGVTGINQATQCTGLNLEHLRRIIRRYTTGPTLEHTGSAPHFHVRHLEE